MKNTERKSENWTRGRFEEGEIRPFSARDAMDKLYMGRLESQVALNDLLAHILHEIESMQVQLSELSAR